MDIDREGDSGMILPRESTGGGVGRESISKIDSYEQVYE